MSSETSQDGDWLRTAARRHYHPPHETPREELWEGIQRARSSGDAPAAADDDREDRISTRWLPRRAGRAAALAAAVALGVVIGRGTVGPLTPSSADGPPAAGRTASTTTPGGTSAPAAGSAASPALERATRDVLQRAEVLLTGFRSDPAGEVGNRQTARWAGEMLTATRLLLDSRAARDPSTRELLRDLEIVLAQLAALPDDSAGSRAEAEIVSRGIDERDVLGRIRMMDERRTAMDR